MPKRQRSRTITKAPAAPLRREQSGWMVCLIVVVTTLVFANGLSGPFLADDDLAIASNTHIRNLSHLSDAFTADQESPFAGRPTVSGSFALNYASLGDSVFSFHLVNLAIHIGCALLVFGLVRRTLRSPRFDSHLRDSGDMLAFLTALLWAIHPLTTEVVDYLTQRTESLMALCYLGTLYASLRATSGHRWRWQVIAVGLCAFGMGAKESMVTAPLMVVLYDGAIGFESFAAAWRSRGKFYACLASTWIVLALLIRSGPRMYSAGFSAGVSPWTYLWNQSVMITRYLRLAVWPRDLVLLYGPPVNLHLRDVWPSVIGLLLLALLSVALLARRRALGFALAWVFITLAPSSSIVPIATEVGAERRMYLPLVAVVAVAVTGGAWLWQAAACRFPRSRTVAALCVAVAVMALSTATILRNQEYRSRLGMAETVLARWPTGAAHAMVGWELALLGRHDDAMAEYRQAVDTYPAARFPYGSELFDRGQYAEAIGQLRAFITAEPLRSEVIRAHLKMARALTERQQWQDAAEECRQVLRMTPHNVEAHVFLADALAGAGKRPEAIAEYQTYLSMRPTDVGAWTSLGLAFIDSDQVTDARAAFQHAATLAPNDARVRADFARSLLLADDVPDAVTEARVAVSLDPTNVADHDLLGRVYAVERRWADARQQYELARGLDPRDGEAAQALRELDRLNAR